MLLKMFTSNQKRKKTGTLFSDFTKKKRPL